MSDPDRRRRWRGGPLTGQVEKAERAYEQQPPRIALRNMGDELAGRPTHQQVTTAVVEMLAERSDDFEGVSLQIRPERRRLLVSHGPSHWTVELWPQPDREKVACLTVTARWHAPHDGTEVVTRARLEGIDYHQFCRLYALAGEIAGNLNRL